eukprot:674380-Pelagomonas_calceolata.AAC.1
MSIVFAIRRFQGGELGGTLKMQRVLLGWSAWSLLAMPAVSHSQLVKCLLPWGNRVVSSWLRMQWALLAWQAADVLQYFTWLSVLWGVGDI